MPFNRNERCDDFARYYEAAKAFNDRSVLVWSKGFELCVGLIAGFVIV